MKILRTGAELEAQLRVRGIGRFIGAAFLSVWLTGWAAGEAFALWALVWGARSLLTGQPPGHLGMALAMGVFLLFWLTLWTIGGIAAGRELLRLLFGRDRIRTSYDGLEVEHSFGLFRSVKRFPRAEIRRFYRTGAGARLCVETTGGTTIVLTQLGTPAERAELEQTLNDAFHLETQPASVGALPKDWCEVLSLERDSVLVKDPAVRRKQARTAWITCACVSFIPLYLLSANRDRPDLLGALIFFVALGGLLGWGALWLSIGRKEWRLDKGRLVLQRRFGQNRTPRFEAVSLELIEDSSGDDGTSYLLLAVAPGAPPRPRSHSVGRHRRTIFSQSDDPTESRNLGLWLSQRCQLPFLDLTTAAAKAKDIEDLKKQLADSGRFGKLALRIVERLAPSPPR